MNKLTFYEDKLAYFFGNIALYMQTYLVVTKTMAMKTAIKKRYNNVTETIIINRSFKLS